MWGFYELRKMKLTMIAHTLNLLQLLEKLWGNKWWKNSVKVDSLMRACLCEKNKCYTQKKKNSQLPSLNRVRSALIPTVNICAPPEPGTEKQAAATPNTRDVEVAPTRYTFEWFQRGHQLKATNMSLECEPTQLKVLHECIKGISCELALWIHKAVFIPPTLSLIQEAEGAGSFWSQPVPLFFFFFFFFCLWKQKKIESA